MIRGLFLASSLKKAGLGREVVRRAVEKCRHQKRYLLIQIMSNIIALFYSDWKYKSEFF